jgi:hypothetical protein
MLKTDTLRRSYLSQKHRPKIRVFPDKQVGVIGKALPGRGQVSRMEKPIRRLRIHGAVLGPDRLGDNGILANHRQFASFPGKETRLGFPDPKDLT